MPVAAHPADRLTTEKLASERQNPTHVCVRAGAATPRPQRSLVSTSPAEATLAPQRLHQRRDGPVELRIPTLGVADIEGDLDGRLHALPLQRLAVDLDLEHRQDQQALLQQHAAGAEYCPRRARADELAIAVLLEAI